MTFCIRFQKVQDEKNIKIKKVFSSVSQGKLVEFGATGGFPNEYGGGGVWPKYGGRFESAEAFSEYTGGAVVSWVDGLAALLSGGVLRSGFVFFVLSLSSFIPLFAV
jgi:hypothetical protein